ncbi:hypothetical protein MRB53_041252 [Persea americana]|nr:hypothetical protein MRB53_041252 [Persea americana]
MLCRLHKDPELHPMDSRCPIDGISWAGSQRTVLREGSTMRICVALVLNKARGQAFRRLGEALQVLRDLDLDLSFD